MRFKPILSIIIPTYNRYNTLIPVVNNLLKWESQDFEIIVQDNSSNNDIALSYLLTITNEKRLKYFYTPYRLSAIENCDLAVSNSEGYYVCFIGDDDGIIPEILNICYWLKKNSFDSMCCNVPLYTWTDMEHAISINNAYNGKLVIPKFTGDFEIINPNHELIKLINSGAQNLFKIPRLYQGVVSKNILNELKKIVGTYFPGPVPDMSNAVAISSLIQRHCFIDLPFIIAGHSKNSMSGKNSKRLHQGEIISEKSLDELTASKWSKKIPFFWSAPTIWSEAAIKSLEKMNLYKELEMFNYANVYASCLTYCDTKYYYRIFNAINYNFTFISKIILYSKVLFYINKIITKRIFNLARKIFIGINGIDCSNLEDAIKICSIEIKKVQKNFE
jgi:glycosyltransferase involved in cell wall biosynthesis